MLRAFTVFLVALLVRLCHLWLLRDSVLTQVLLGDGWKYDQWAQQIATGDWIGREVFYQSPLYPYLLAVTYTLFGHDVWIVRLWQAVLGSAASAFLTIAGTRIFNSRVGWIAGLLMALYPPAIFFDSILQKASLDLFLLSCLLLFVSSCFQRPKSSGFFGAGMSLGAFILNRENAAVVAPILLLWSYLQFERNWRWPTTVFLGMALVLGPVAMRNLWVGGELVVTTSQMGPNFYIGNHRAASGRYESLRPLRGDARFESNDARLLAEEDLQRPLSPSEISRYWMRRSMAEIQSDPLGWIKLLGLKTFLTLHHGEVTDTEGFSVYRSESAILKPLSWLLGFGIVLPLAVLGVWLTRSEWRRLWLLYAMTLALAAGVIAFYVMARYRYPLVPLLLLFAGAGLVTTYDRFRLKNGFFDREIWLGVAISLPFALLSNWPVRTADQGEVTYLNIGTALLDEGRAAEALAPLRQAAAINPHFAAVYNNMGLAYLALNDHDQAKAAFDRAIRLDPDIASAHFNLAKCLLEQGDLSAANEHVQRALVLDPLLAPAHHLLGRLRISRGDRERGIAAFRRAVELDPQNPGARGDLAMAWIQQGELRQGTEELRRILEQHPKALQAANNLIWILATSPDENIRAPRESLELAMKYIDRAVSPPPLLDTLAAAYAANGDFATACQILKVAITRAREAKANKLVQSLEGRLAQYQRGEAYQDPSLSAP